MQMTTGRKLSLLFASASFLLVCYACSSFADTVILKNRKKIKGLILEEFRDRIILSTAGGETAILKKDIRFAVYDSEEKALIKKARNYSRRREYLRAYYIYKKALELDPDLEEAREQLHYLRGILETQISRDIKDELRSKIDAEKSRKKFSEKLADEFGIVLGDGDKYTVVKSVRESAVSSRSDRLQSGDRIVSVWGEMAGYMDADEVAGMMLSSDENKFVIERDTSPTLGHSSGLLDRFTGDTRGTIGGTLKLSRKGVVVTGVKPGGAFALAGIKKGDIIYRIKGRNTRYMPMRKIAEILKKNEGKAVEIVVRRTVTMWRKKY